MEDDFLFGAISNSTSVGGILTLDPKKVDLSDGLFEVLLIRPPKNLTEFSESLMTLPYMDYDNCAMMTFTSAKRVRIYADPNMTWTLDGERQDGREVVETENLCRAFRLMQKVNRDA